MPCPCTCQHTTARPAHHPHLRRCAPAAGARGCPDTSSPALAPSPPQHSRSEAPCPAAASAPCSAGRSRQGCGGLAGQPQCAPPAACQGCPTAWPAHQYGLSLSSPRQLEGCAASRPWRRMDCGQARRARAGAPCVRQPVAGRSSRSRCRPSHPRPSHATQPPTHLKEDIDDAGIHDQVIIRHHHIVVAVPQVLPHTLPRPAPVRHQCPHHLPLHRVWHAQRQRALRVVPTCGGGRRVGSEAAARSCPSPASPLRPACAAARPARPAAPGDTPTACSRCRSTQQ